MSPVLTKAHPAYDADEIKLRLENCPKLASLQSINREFAALVSSEQSMNSQIADIIRRDPSLSTRLLRMVNSVYYGLSDRVTSVEDAVFFLGLRQIRELARATPVIEELEKMQSTQFAPELWKRMWTHSIGTALLTREILALVPDAMDEDTNYLSGLLHNLGKILMAHSFPAELSTIVGMSFKTPNDVCAMEREVIGWDHAQMGGHYLGHHNLAEEVILAVRFHNAPETAPQHQIYPAAVQVADQMMRQISRGDGFEQVEPLAEGAWTDLTGWHILFGDNEVESSLAQASLGHVLQKLPDQLNGML
jgi:HD-like signal output (HDOD) protein